MSFLQEFLTIRLLGKLDDLYRAFIHALGGEVTGTPDTPPVQGGEATQKEIEVQCIVPRVLQVIQKAEAIVNATNLRETPLGLHVALQELFRVCKHDIGSFHTAMLQHHPVPLEVNGHEKYPELMTEIDSFERLLPEFFIPEPFELPPLPRGSGPVPQRHVHYTYDDMPLPTRSSIRLISLCPTQSTEINVSLRTVDLQNNPCYTTLSYTWGPPVNVFRTAEERQRIQSQLDDPWMQMTVQITCNGKPLRVTENLFRFLCHWRDGSFNGKLALTSRESNEIWIDAICINQNDLIEKNAQVAMMGKIYSKSQGAYIWLGEEDCFSQVAIPILQQLATFSKDWNSLRKLGQKAAADELWKRGILVQSWGFMCVFAFLKREWFRRSWICQEIAFAPELMIFCGNESIDWETLVMAVMYLVSTELINVIEATASAEVRYLTLEEFARQDDPYNFAYAGGDLSHRNLFYLDNGNGVPLLGGASIPLLDKIRKADPSKRPIGSQAVVFGPVPRIEFTVIELFISAPRFMKASNPRDKVYAFLDLARRPCYAASVPHPERRHLEPRYELDVTDVYLEASWYILLTGQNLDLLSWAEARSEANQCMPSWVVDWEAQMTSDSFAEASAGSGWRASGGSIWEVPELKLYRPTLTVHGWNICVISAAASGSFCLSKAALVAGDSPEIYHLATNSQTRVEALWRTLVADYVDLESPAPLHIQDDFRNEWAWMIEETRTRCKEATTEAAQDADETLYRFLQAEDKLNILPEGVQEAVDTQQQTRISGTGFKDRMWKTSNGRKFFRTDTNHFGNGPKQLKTGDQVWVLSGADIPFVLRPQSCGNYRLIGDAYVHGIMRGEALDIAGVKREELEIV